MADRYWVGANGTSGAATAYATTASWSASKNGASGASIPDPAVPDIVRFDTATTGSKFVNVNQSIGNIPNIYFVNSGGNWALAGSSSTAAGTAWTLTAPVTIDVGPTSAADAQFNNSISASGSAKIIKTGQGSFSSYTITSTTWGTCPIDLQEGTILFGAVNDKLGTGKITQSAGTYLANATATAYTLNNPIDVIGDVVWNYEPNLPASTARGLMTLKATVDFGAVARTVQIGATGNTNATTITGAVTGTAGFTKSGPGTLTLSNNAGSTLSGNVKPSAGTLSIGTTVLQNATINWTGTLGTLSYAAGTTVGAFIGDANFALPATLTVGSSTATAAPNLSGTYSGVLSGSSLVTKAGTGTWTLDGANTTTGGFTINAGTIVANSAAALGGSTGAITVNSNGALQIGATVSKSSATLTIAGTGVGGTGALRSASGNNSYTASGYTLTAGSTIQVDAGSLTLGAAGATIGSGALTKAGAGELILLQTSNSYSGGTVISAGTATVSAGISAGAVNSPLGTGTVEVSGTLKFNGSSAGAFARAISINGSTPALEAAGTSTGTMTVSSISVVAGSGTRTLTLKGASTLANVLSANISNSGGVTVALAKADAGTWNLTGALTHTGGINLTAGTLGANGGTLTYSAGNLNVSGGTLVDTIVAPVVMTGGSVTGTLSSTTTLTVNSGSDSTVYPSAGANTYNGATSVATGGVLLAKTDVAPSVAGAGKILGNSNVSVTGYIKTGAAGLQKGQARYGGNLTFNANSRLYIGGA